MRSDPSTSEPLRRLGFVQRLVDLAHRRVVDNEVRTSGGGDQDASSSNDSNFLTEHLFSALCFLAQTNADCLAECRRPESTMKITLEKRLAQIGGRSPTGSDADEDPFQEETLYVKDLLKLLEGTNGS